MPKPETLENARESNERPLKLKGLRHARTMVPRSLGALGILAAIVALLAPRLLYRVHRAPASSVTQHVRLLRDEEDKREAVERFVRTLRVAAVADVDAPNHVSDRASFEELHRVLRSMYAPVFDRMEVEVVDEFSLLMTWPGNDGRLDPLLLVSHLDVVPAVQGGAYDAFAATIEDGRVFARGALDTKFTACAILEALQTLAVDHAELNRTVIVALGHDEEVGGFGAHSMAELLKARGVRPELVLDEGGMVAMERHQGWLADIEPFALVGLAEKTAMNFEVTVLGQGGHGSLPPRPGLSAASRLAALVGRLERETLPTRLEDAMVDFCRAVSEWVKLRPLAWVLGRAVSAVWRPVVGQLLGRPLFGAKLNALVRTTTGVVELRAGDGAQNVLPRQATVGVNVRTLPGDSREDVRSYLQHLAGPDGRVRDVSAVVYPELTTTSADSDAFRVVARAIRETLSHRAVFGREEEAKDGRVVKPMSVVPFLLTGMTDSRWYHEIAPGRVVRFSPFALSFDELKLIHGVDERVALTEYYDAVRFYYHLIVV